ncbi:MAG: c-type cytochrome, partial [bacterium]|nr:c-type cytochrome [bacterium]
GGQGRATQIKGHPLEKGDYPHGFDKYWLNPLLRGDYVESSCNKCHVNQFVLDLAPVYTQGKELFVEYGCINCHKVDGLDWAPKIGPDLASIKEKVYPEWMFAWVKQPTTYLPHTRMPQVPWESDDEVIQTISYIFAKSKPHPYKFGKYPGGGNVSEGEKTFNEVGCFACHQVDGKGGDAGPALDKVMEKTTADWVYNWIQEPKNWSDHARMPSLRLTGEEARNLTAYLNTKGKPPASDEKLRMALAEEENIKKGFRVIGKYGCYACHNIEGFEGMSRPSVDLSNFGRKDVHELAFGDAKIPETWEAWTIGKLTNPQMFLDERSTSAMPKPNINEEQRHALVVFLRGQRPEELPKERLAYDPVVEKGRHLVWWYNCKQCHVIEGQGGKVSEWIKEPNFLPPNLADTGARLQTHWMYQFLKNPASYPKVRDWLNIRMPTFGFNDAETGDLVQYFKRIADVKNVLEDKPKLVATPEEMAAGSALVGNNNFACGSCHIIKGVRPAAGPTVWAPDLAYGHHRLRPPWLNKWVRDPAKLVPGIRMPGYYPPGAPGPEGILGGDVDRQVQAIVDYVISLGNPESVVIKGRSLPEESTAQEAPAEEEKATEAGEGDEQASGKKEKGE